jgi:hypothetical protein
MELSARGTSAALEDPPTPDDVALFLHTSGTPQIFPLTAGGSTCAVLYGFLYLIAELFDLGT